MKPIKKLRRTLTNLSTNDYSEFGSDQLATFITVHSKELLLTLNDLEKDLRALEKEVNKSEEVKTFLLNKVIELATQE